MITVVPDISADVEASTAGAEFELDPGVIDEIFAELAPVQPSVAPVAEDPYALAREYLNKGLLDLSAAEAARSIARGGDPVEAAVLTGTIYARQGLYGEARERFHQARQRSPERVDAYLGEFAALLALDRGGQALDDAETLAARHPDNMEVKVMLARVRLASGDPAGALGALNEARTRAPQRADIFRLEGDILVGMDDLTAACQAYQHALVLDPKLTDLQYTLGQIYERREDWYGAEAAYREALDALPAYSEAAVALANLFVKRDTPRDAVDLLIDILAVCPSDRNALFALGRALFRDDHIDEALQAFERLVTYDDTNVEALFYMAVGLARRRHFTQAVAAWQRVIALDPASSAAQRARRHIRSATDLKRIFSHEAA